MTQRRTAVVAFAWALLVLLALQVAILGLFKYVLGGLEAPPPILANAFASPHLAIHVAAASVALVVGPLQFVERLRTSRPSFHRACGLVYVAACAISFPAALLLALGSAAGPVAGAGFLVLDLLLALFTILGLRAALDRRFAEHREWMIRSYAMTATAITLRLMLPAAGLLGFDFLPGYVVIAWLSWATNLALAEYWIRRTRGVAVRLAVPAPA